MCAHDTCMLRTVMVLERVPHPSRLYREGRGSLIALHMPKNLKRYYGDGHLHFITCSCYLRLPLLGDSSARNEFVKILGEVRIQYEFALAGYVVMPEHVHLLISESARGMPSAVLQVLKQRVARNLREDRKAELRQFWHRRIHDFNVWSHEKRIEKLEYMHMNPVKRGLVGDPKDWVWSSYLFYTGDDNGLLRIDPVD
jgi:putative transposase